MNPLQDHAWLALCLASEDSDEKAWPYLAQVIWNRYFHPRWPDDHLRDVVLQPKQFSYFNRFDRGTQSDEHIFSESLKGYPGRMFYDALVYSWEPPFMRLLPAHTYHFWAPDAMAGGRDPSWARNMEIITIPEIPQWRFGVDMDEDSPRIDEA